MFKYILTYPDLDQNDVYKQHQQLTALFTNSTRIRFRVDPGNEVTVHSDKPPVESITCKTSILKDYPMGTIIKFRVRANVEKRKFVKGGKGNRVGITDPNQVAEWFKKQADLYGFSIENVINVSSSYYLHGVKKNIFSICAVDFEGILKVLDADKFKKAYENGIGSSKGFGFGLLLADYVFQS